MKEEKQYRELVCICDNRSKENSVVPPSYVPLLCVKVLYMSLMETTLCLKLPADLIYCSIYSTNEHKRVQIKLRLAIIKITKVNFTMVANNNY